MSTNTSKGNQMKFINKMVTCVKVKVELSIPCQMSLYLDGLYQGFSHVTNVLCVGNVNQSLGGSFERNILNPEDHKLKRFNHTSEDKPKQTAEEDIVEHKR